MTSIKNPQYLKDLQLIKTLSITIISLLLSISLYSQQDNFALKAEELIYSDPNEAIKIAEHILNASHELQERARANIILSKSYLVKGDYNKSTIYAFDHINQSDKLDVEFRIEINILKAEILRKLYIDKQSQEYLYLAQQLTTTLSSNKDIYENLIVLERINFLIDRRNIVEAINTIMDAENQFNSFYNKNIDERKSIYLAKELAFRNQAKIDSAEVYINKLLFLMDTNHGNNLYKKASIYSEIGHLYLQKKEFNKSEENFFIALKFAEILDNPFLLEQINRDLAINYLATNQNTQHKVYNDEFLILNNQIEQIEQKSVNTLFNIFSNQIEDSIKVDEKKYKTSFYIVLVCYFIIFSTAFFLILKDENRKKRLREIINYLEVGKSDLIKSKPSKKAISKRINIPEETERNIILKLKRFENSKKFLNKDLSQAVLAAQFDTNTKYLSEIINKHYDENFNAFINRLRINYIIKKLKNDSNYVNYKISYLAEECGYASHSGFATVFKAIVGISPVTFINLLKTEKEEIKKKNK